MVTSLIIFTVAWSIVLLFFKVGHAFFNTIAKNHEPVFIRWFERIFTVLLFILVLAQFGVGMIMLFKGLNGWVAGIHVVVALFLYYLTIALPFTDHSWYTIFNAGEQNEET